MPQLSPDFRVPFLSSVFHSMVGQRAAARVLGGAVALAAGCSPSSPPAAALIDGGIPHDHEDDVGNPPGEKDAGIVPDAGEIVFEPGLANVNVSHHRACVVLETERVRCWGQSAMFWGYQGTGSIGDDEVPASVGDLDFGGPVVQVVQENGYGCALRSDGTVVCWGGNPVGQLGYGHTEPAGMFEDVPAVSGAVDVGGPVVQLAGGWHHVCALLATGTVRCWGNNQFGELGYGHTERIGDDELPSAAGDVDVGGPVVQISAGANYTCALLATGAVRCWGQNSSGELGYGHTNHIGDDELPSSTGDIDVGGTVVQISATGAHTCARLSTGKARCWGKNDHGGLGYGHTEYIGDDEPPSSAGDIDVGGTVAQIAAGSGHTCALLSTARVRCWGKNTYGELGYGHTEDIGDDELPSSAGNVDVGGDATAITVGALNSCATFASGNVKCWGYSSNYVLGNPSLTSHVGDNEHPSSIGDICVRGTEASCPN